MADQHSPEYLELLRRFPDLKPIKGTPTLYTLNGIGASMYGKRDFDEQTNTYVKTHCLCLIFIPVLALGAYRVADAERGWYFIGKEPLSGFARIWNKIIALLAVLMVSSIAWNVHTSSPEYQARQKMAEAGRLMKAGAYVKAAGIYRSLIHQPKLGDTARVELQKALEAGLNAGGDAAVSSYQLLSTLPVAMLTSAPIIPQPMEKGMALAADLRATKPSDGLLVLDAVQKISPTNSEIPVLREKLLLAGTQMEPGELKFLEPLAALYETQERTADYVALLEPHKDKLGQSECARMLGQQFMEQNRYNDAYLLLHPYVQGRLATLAAAESSYTNAAEVSYRAALQHLNDGKADRAFYQRYENASKDAQDTMVDDFIQTWLKSDPAYQRAIAQLREANRIVPVTLDLGIIQLNRAQSLEDPVARRAELEAAEKTFLAIQGSAGESDEYRLFLGQVYYWLGRAPEGKELFDALLAAQERAVPLLMSLGNIYRELGDSHNARQFLEEAYAKATTDLLRHRAAAARARIEKDIDDEISWLQKSDLSELSGKIDLSGARARKALSSGNRTEAARQLREVVDGYAKMARTAVTLNNWGLAQMTLFEATGKLEDYRKGVQLMEEAIAMDQGNSILLNNISSVLMSEALMEVSGDKFRYIELGDAPDLGMMISFYRDQSEQAELVRRLRATDAMKRCLGYMERALLLSPRSIPLYKIQLRLASDARDFNELKKLQQRIQAAQLDLSQQIKDQRETLSPAKNAETLENLRNSIKRLDGLIRDAGPAPHPPTHAHLVNQRDALLMGTAIFGEKPELPPLLARAKKNHEILDSCASLQHLEGVHMQLAGEELARISPDFATLQKQTRRFLAMRDMFVLFLERGGKAADALQRNQNFLAAVEIEKERARRFSSYPSPGRWALLRHFDAPLAETIRRDFLASEQIQLETLLDAELSPMDATSILDAYWGHVLSGRSEQANEFYVAAVNRGLALPKPGGPKK